MREFAPHLHRLLTLLPAISFSALVLCRPVAVTAPVLPTHSAEIKIIYSRQESPMELTVKQRQNLDDALAKDGARREVWFVYVRSNSNNEAGTLSAEVFFKPDKSSARLRKGSVSDAGGFESNVKLWPADPYFEVSPKDRPFKDGELAIPDQQYLPFPAPVNEQGKLPSEMKDADVIGLADFARDTLGRNWGDVEPITSIVKDDDDVLTVTTGFSSGSIIKIRKVGSAWALIGRIGLWAN
ncbi:MAG TPA: hypothetical protein VFE47_02650 [Tepidisphaeraceae bacterium]|jgi:hypothetical protein|nr:hypothetical protein [Tepidisphaeraceae bacterium]